MKREFKVVRQREKGRKGGRDFKKVRKAQNKEMKLKTKNRRIARGSTGKLPGSNRAKGTKGSTKPRLGRKKGKIRKQENATARSEIGGWGGGGV